VNILEYKIYKFYNLFLVKTIINGSQTTSEHTFVMNGSAKMKVSKLTEKKLY